MTTKIILPVRNAYSKKDQVKSDKANKFIGHGSPASSTHAYAVAWGDKANCGAYQASDVVFLSVEGSRSGRKSLDVAELQLAINAGATIITDDAANRNRAYNIGERQAAKYLLEHGYTEYLDGVWRAAAREHGCTIFKDGAWR
jgi:hypothetical protein